MYYSNNSNIPFYCGNNDAFEKLNEISNSENLYTLTMLINTPELNCFDKSYGTWVINYKDDTINLNSLWGGSVLCVITRWEDYQANLLNNLIKYNNNGKEAVNFKYPLVSNVINKGNSEHGQSIVFADYNYNILITSDYLKPYIGRIKLEY